MKLKIIALHIVLSIYFSIEKGEGLYAFEVLNNKLNFIKEEKLEEQVTVSL